MQSESYRYPEAGRGPRGPWERDTDSGLVFSLGAAGYGSDHLGGSALNARHIGIDREVRNTSGSGVNYAGFPK